MKLWDPNARASQEMTIVLKRFRVITLGIELREKDVFSTIEQEFETSRPFFLGENWLMCCYHGLSIRYSIFNF